MTFHRRQKPGKAHISLLEKSPDMICHIVLYNMKPGKTSKDEEWLAQEARQQLARLPGVQNLRAGRNLAPAKGSYALALVMEFEDNADLEAYRVHPDHQKFVKEIAGPLVDEVFRYDFEWR